MKILITGAGGRIGEFVAKEFLAHGYHVRALDVHPMAKELRERGAELVYADLTDPLEALKAADGCEGLVHLAAIPSPWRGRSALLLDVNIKGTYNILEAAHAAGIEKAIITSSVGALGFSFPAHRVHPDYLPVDASHPRRVQDIYGLTKETNEITAEMFTRRHGMTTIAIRPPMVVDLHHAIHEGWMPRMLERSKDYRSDLWGYIDNADLARAFRLAWEAKLDAGSYNVFYTMADDILSTETPRALIERLMPELIGYADKVGNSFYDLAPAKEKLGFTAELFWRDAVAEAEK